MDNLKEEYENWCKSMNIDFMCFSKARYEGGGSFISKIMRVKIGEKEVLKSSSFAWKMCIFTSDKDIPGNVRLSTRTLQYLIIPLLSAALLVIGKDKTR